MNILVRVSSRGDFSLRLQCIYIVRRQFTRHVLSSLRSRLRSLRPYGYDRYGCTSRPFCDNSGINGFRGRVKSRESAPPPTFNPFSSGPFCSISKSSLSPGGPPRKFIVLRRRHPRDPTQLGSLMTSRVTRNTLASLVGRSI